MGNPVVHWERMSKQPVKVADFYARIFGWKVDHRPDMNYRIDDTASGSGPMAGMGSFCLFTDPEGRMMGLWKAK